MNTDNQNKYFTNDLNKSRALIMHVDINSCFATLEQQANPLLRGKPVAITNRLTKNATIITASYEAKALGIRTGTKIEEAKALAPTLVTLESDPEKYIHANQILCSILSQYSPDVHIKSIDEGLIDFTTVQLLEKRDLDTVAKEIKQEIKQKLGEWVTCNIGIGPNRFLAKFAAGLQKPDGLTRIDHTNIRTMYSFWSLRDLPGINYRLERRLKLATIHTPLQFLNTPLPMLWHQIFKGICGYYWHRRLRGWEVDEQISATKSVGKQYVLPPNTPNHKLEAVIFKLCQLLGRRLRAKNLCAKTITAGYSYKNGYYFHATKTSFKKFYSTQEIFETTQRILLQAPKAPIRILFIRCYNLSSSQSRQIEIFTNYPAKNWEINDITDSINDRFGEFTIIPASMYGTTEDAKPKIAFGNTNL
jgi:DNA polymerase IV